MGIRGPGSSPHGDTKPGSIPVGCLAGWGLPRVPPAFPLPSLGAYLLREGG